MDTLTEGVQLQIAKENQQERPSERAPLGEGKAFVLFFESWVCTFTFVPCPTNYVACLGLDSGETLQVKKGEKQAVHRASY